MSTQRNDIRPADESVGKDAYEVYCVNCYGYRGTWSLQSLPEPGICYSCRGLDPHTYWTRDWPDNDAERRTPR